MEARYVSKKEGRTRAQTKQPRLKMRTKHVHPSENCKKSSTVEGYPSMYKQKVRGDRVSKRKRRKIERSVDKCTMNGQDQS